MNIAVLCTLSTGLFAIKEALNKGVKIDRIIGLNPNKEINSVSISGYVDIKNFCKENSLKHFYVKDYSLKEEDASFLLDDIDLLWVNGWQRLIPDQFINKTTFGAIGTHGSCDGITRGRGRSPQNWALMMGAKKFELSLFKISPGIDDGSIIYTDFFSIEPYDNIKTSYLKVALSIARCIQSIYENPNIIDEAKPQTGVVEYFPKRIPSDGSIDWSMSAKDISNQIRALSDPYPNATTYLKNKEISIKRSTPILSKVDYQNGSIVQKLSNDNLLVAAKDGFVLIEEFTSTLDSKVITEGSIFESIDMGETVKSIINRFNKEFPGKTLNSTLVNFWEERGIKVSLK